MGLEPEDDCFARVKIKTGYLIWIQLYDKGKVMDGNGGQDMAGFLF